MFKEGDKIVCVNIEHRLLEMYKIYTLDYYVTNRRTVLITIEFSDIWFDTESFISLQEYRKLKLEKLNKSII